MRQELLGEDQGAERSDLGGKCDVSSAGGGSVVKWSQGPDHAQSRINGETFAQPLQFAVGEDWNNKSKKNRLKKIIKIITEVVKCGLMGDVCEAVVKKLTNE